MSRALNAGDLAGDAAAAVPHHGAHVLVRPQRASETCFLGGNIIKSLDYVVSPIWFKSEDLSKV